MAGDVVNIKVCVPLELSSGLTGNYHAICHYSYNFPLAPSGKKTNDMTRKCTLTIKQTCTLTVID